MPFWLFAVAAGLLGGPAASCCQEIKSTCACFAGEGRLGEMSWGDAAAAPSEPIGCPRALGPMYTAAQLRLIARHYRQRAVDAERPSMQGMLMVMADEFERDALIADREERLAAFRRQAAERMSEAPNVVAVEIAA